MNSINKEMISTLFGNSGIIYHDLLEDITKDLYGTTYRFIEFEEYLAIAKTSIPKAMKIYWQEILYRAHWVANANLIRHSRLWSACLHLYSKDSNYLGFAACLRSLLESSCDAFYTLRNVPLTLAQNRDTIKAALDGNCRNLITCSELENALIHFLCARKLDKKEIAPDSHKAEALTSYIASADINDGDGGKIKELYSYLCQVAHPSALSLDWMTSMTSDIYKINTDLEGQSILLLCSKHADAIKSIQMNSINSSILTFKVLNKFEHRKIYSKVIDSINMDGINAWRTVNTYFD